MSDVFTKMFEIGQRWYFTFCKKPKIGFVGLDAEIFSNRL